MDVFPSKKVFFGIKISKKCHKNHNFDVGNRNLVVIGFLWHFSKKGGAPPAVFS